MNQEIKCNKCNTNMEKGFFYTRMSAHADTFHYTVWMKGNGIDDYIKMLKSRNTPQYPISSYRCPNCGLIEYYANQPPENWKS